MKELNLILKCFSNLSEFQTEVRLKAIACKHHQLTIIAQKLQKFFFAAVV